jgi:pyruvate/2-oxoglutarate/acetoin dehydrogenase E1 component
VNCLSNPPVRIALPDAPAPSSKVLEKAYYTKTKDLIKTVKKIIKK